MPIEIQTKNPVIELGIPGSASGGGWPADLPKPSVGGYGYTESGEQTTITWDGDTDGRVAIDSLFYKISELTPTIEEMVGGVVYTRSQNDDIFQEEITSDSITTLSEHVYQVKGYGRSVVLVALENDEIEGIIIERGMYYSKEGSGVLSTYVTSLTYGTPDTVHKIDDKYLPEGYPTKSVQTTTLMEEQAVEFTLDNPIYYAILPNPFEISVGQTYIVNWDGTEYECVCFALTDNVYRFGNMSILNDGDDTGEPFLYRYKISKQEGFFETLDTSASHTISVKTIEEIVTPMAEEFLPANTKNTTVFYFS